MRSTISMKLIIKLLLILCAYCACWTTTLAIELPSHQKQQIAELLLEDAKPILKFPWEELDQLQLSQRRPPPPRRSPPPPPRRSPPPPPRRSPPPPPRRSPPPPPMRSPPPPPPMISPPPPPPAPFEENYPKVSFELIDSTAKTYNDFILKIRNELKGPDVKFNIPMMRNPDTITDSNRFLLVELSNKEQKYSTTLAVRVSDGYMVGYCCGKYDEKAKKHTAWFFTPDTEIFKEENKLLFNGKEVIKQELGFKGNYDSLGNRAIPLGWRPMDTSIADLAKTEKGKDLAAVKRAAVILIQMVLEATRYRYISDKVAAAVQNYNEFTPDPLMLSYQNNWGTLSEAVATSVGEGVFKQLVELKDDNGKLLRTVGYVWQIRDELSLLGFVKT